MVQQADTSAGNQMSRYDVTSALVSRLGETDAVIGGIGNTNFDLCTVQDRGLNFYMLGSMGLAIPIALGVAIAQPNRRVIALEGDGSILMQLGVFGTVAKRGQANLGMIIMDNGVYQITGSQPTVTSSATDIAGVARACGIAHTATVTSVEEFGERLDGFLTLGQPWVIVARIDRSAARGETERRPIKIRDKFMKALTETA